MAKQNYVVTGETYTQIDRRVIEFKNQLLGKRGSRLDPNIVLHMLQRIIDGHFIDCDAPPLSPDFYQLVDGDYENSEWGLVSHRKDGILDFDKSRFELRDMHEQLKQEGLTGSQVLAAPESSIYLNANVLDWFLNNPRLVPKDWRGLNIFFMATVYSYGGGHRKAVRYMYWEGRRWNSEFKNLTEEWGSEDVLAVIYPDRRILI